MHKGDRQTATRSATMDAVVGIDVAKATLAIVVLQPDGRQRHKACANTAQGQGTLVAWLAQRVARGTAIGLEATGGYQEAVALALHDAGYAVSVLNPSAVAAYGQSQLRRAKTDPTDAALIADFMRTQTPPRWIPPAPEARQLQALVRRLDAVLEMHTQETNRREIAVPIVRPSIDTLLTELDAQVTALKRQIAAHIDQFPTLRQQRDLIVSIPGIGDTTAAIVLGELLDPTRFASARALAAFAGLVPQVQQSGTSRRGRGALTKIGAGRLRKALYFPALAAMRSNPPLIAFTHRLRAAGKPTMVVVAAVMRKLLHQIYGVLHSGRPFDPARA
jgi:transposase